MFSMQKGRSVPQPIVELNCLFLNLFQSSTYLVVLELHKLGLMVKLRVIFSERRIEFWILKKIDEMTAITFDDVLEVLSKVEGYVAEVLSTIFVEITNSEISLFHNELGLGTIDFLAKRGHEFLQGVSYGGTVPSISFGEESEVVIKEEMRDFETFGGSLDQGPFYLFDRKVNIPGQSLYAENK
ncbi:hypothetical protein H5410_004673 [Solanum commersonii]|uniref:Uncharacterized protein n=1 Tax=Solanum commersonii TaxID=4109 RepID=A0A9J6B8T9_SOLCO|nr:hypothetical protein H5410_004673 [Solanum commersonii]